VFPEKSVPTPLHLCLTLKLQTFSVLACGKTFMYEQVTKKGHLFQAISLLDRPAVSTHKQLAADMRSCGFQFISTIPLDMH